MLPRLVLLLLLHDRSSGAQSTLTGTGKLLAPELTATTTFAAPPRARGVAPLAAELLLGRSRASAVSTQLFFDAAAGVGGPWATRFGVQSRLDLGRLAALVPASFATSSVGVGYEGARPPSLEIPGLRVDDRGLLVARVGYGIYLGKPQSPRRAELYLHYDYDQRVFTTEDKDLRAAAASPKQHSLTLEATWFLTPTVGLHLNAQIGNTWLAGLSLVVAQ